MSNPVHSGSLHILYYHIYVSCNFSVVFGRDARNGFLSFQFQLGFQKQTLWFGLEWVWFGLVQKMRFGSDIIVSYYLCNSRVVNLQQILQRQWMTWLWRHSQQRQQVNNVIAFWNLYAKLSLGSVLKHYLSAHLMRVKFFFYSLLFEWQISCSFCRKTVWTDVKFSDGLVFTNRIRTKFQFFCTSLLFGHMLY